jgi:hypothetical protein
VRATARKTYGKTASGKQITDDLIDALAGKAAGYEVKELTETDGHRRGEGKARRDP